jgi:hypothetical protein
MLGTSWFLARGFFYPEDGGETSVYTIHGATFQKTAFFRIAHVSADILSASRVQMELYCYTDLLGDVR